MAEITDKLTSNVAGKFYVDASCIDCGLCRETASAFFQRDDETGLSFVYRQPELSDEISLADEALNNCPSGSIGDDGPAA